MFSSHPVLRLACFVAVGKSFLQGQTSSSSADFGVLGEALSPALLGGPSR